MTTIYRLYTESRDNLLQIIARHVDSANVSTVQGLWQGTIETGAVVERIGADTDLATMLALAEDIRQTNEQTAVLVLAHYANGRIARYDVTADTVANVA